MNVGVVGLQEPRISVTLYISKTYLLSATQIEAATWRPPAVVDRLGLFALLRPILFFCPVLAQKLPKCTEINNPKEKKTAR